MKGTGDDWLEDPSGFLGPDPPAPAPKKGQKGEKEEPAEQKPAAVWVPLRCPDCGSRRVPVTGKPRGGLFGLRYHRCKDCGLAFKSFESQPE